MPNPLAVQRNKTVTFNVVEPTDPVVEQGIPVDGVPDVSIKPNIVATARRQHGIAGAMLAGGMLAIDEALGLRPAKEEAPIIVASPTDPLDIDNDGIDVPIDDETSAYAPPQPRSTPPVKSNGVRR